MVVAPILVWGRNIWLLAITACPEKADTELRRLIIDHKEKRGIESMEASVVGLVDERWKEVTEPLEHHVVLCYPR
jgi:hypothetical protein